jgi:anti-sigma factor RsiW
MTHTRGWGLSEQHLALDALVAFVDGELTPNARDRAAAHLARCPCCAADAAAQRQARAEVRAAEAPRVPSQLLQALQSIPAETDLHGQPEELGLTADGQLVTIQRRDRSVQRLGEQAALGSGTRLGQGQRLFGDQSGTERHEQRHLTGRRTRQGASVVFSGLVLGALALVNVPTDTEQEPPPSQAPLLGDQYLPAAAPVSVARASIPVSVQRTTPPPASTPTSPPAVSAPPLLTDTP